MEYVISGEKGINSIWLGQEDNLNIISLAKIVVTDEILFNSLINEFRDIRNYVYTFTIESNYSKEHIMYTFDGAEKHEKGSCMTLNNRSRSQNAYTYTTSYYKNPRSEVFRLISGNMRSDQECLLDLFVTTESSGYKISECIREFETALQLIRVLEKSSIEKEMIKKLLKRIWPNFGYYAVEGLKCTDIEIIQNYDIRDFQKIDSEEARRILSSKEVAKTNTKVLSLAKRAYSLTSSTNNRL